MDTTISGEVAVVKSNGPELANASHALDPVLAEHVSEIRRLGKRAIQDVIEIGRRLTVCKEIVGHGNWLSWLEREFGWSQATALNFMHVHELAQTKSANFTDLNLPVSTLYLLAAPSTPEAARTEILERVGAGEQVSSSEVKETIDEAKRADAGTPEIGNGENVTDRNVIRLWDRKTGQESIATVDDVGDADRAGAEADQHDGDGHLDQYDGDNRHHGANVKAEPAEAANTGTGMEPLVAANSADGEPVATSSTASKGVAAPPIGFAGTEHEQNKIEAREPVESTPSIMELWSTAPRDQKQEIVRSERFEVLFSLMSDEQKAEAFDRVVGLQIAQASPVAPSKSNKKLLTNLTGTLYWGITQDDPAAGAQCLKNISTKLAINKRGPKDICFAFVKKGKR
jgi:Protein of unknown function (DUF3102)